MVNNMSIKGQVRLIISLKYLGMQPRAFCFISVIVGCAAFVFALTTSVADTNSIDTASTIGLEERAIDCRDPDYKGHIKCMMRRKRQHNPHVNADNCLEHCRRRCELESDCEKRCSYCNYVKTKQRHQIITEYENECDSAECKKDREDAVNINVTTKIDIRNVIEGGGGGGSNGSNGGGGGGGGSGNNQTCCPTCQPPIACVQPPYYYPQPMNNLWAGCQHPSMWWMCWPSIRQPIDCSDCVPPYTSYKCTVSCSLVQQDTRPCVSPHCVGAKLTV